MTNTAGPVSLVYYFQKGALLGQKVALNLWYVDTIDLSDTYQLSCRYQAKIAKTVPRVFEGLSYLACKI